MQPRSSRTDKNEGGSQASSFSSKKKMVVTLVFSVILNLYFLFFSDALSITPHAESKSNVNAKDKVNAKGEVKRKGNSNSTSGIDGDGLGNGSGDDNDPSRSSGGGKSPMLVLHIGPHKTATSTIQCALVRYREKLYKEASVAYLGRIYGHCKMNGLPEKDRDPVLVGFDRPDFTRGLFRSCFDEPSPPPSECRKSKSWKSLKKRLKYFSNRNASVVLSDEIFTRMILRHVSNRRMFYELFDKYYPGRVRVVMVYRRYFEWAVSFWNSNTKPYRNHITNENDPYKSEFKAWPSDGGEAAMTFGSFLKTLKEGDSWLKEWLKESTRRNLHPVEYLRWLWTNHSSEVLVLNMHDMQNDGEGTVTRFMREILPTPSVAGDALAAAADEDAGFSGRPNPHKNLDFDRLAVAAHGRGLLASAINRTAAPRHKFTELAEKHLLTKLDTTIDRLPRTCPDETLLREFLNRSLEYEHRIYPDRWSEEASRDHQSAFSKAESEGKFCNLDTDKLIEDDAVQEFFTTDVVPLLQSSSRKDKIR